MAKRLDQELQRVAIAQSAIPIYAVSSQQAEVVPVVTVPAATVLIPETKVAVDQRLAHQATKPLTKVM